MLARIASVAAFWKMGRLAWRLLKDGRVPPITKLVPAGALFYVLFPADLLPDFIPALGQFDDLTVLTISLVLFVRLSPRDLVRGHMDAMAGRPSGPGAGEPPHGDIIDGDYEVLE